MRGEDFFRHWPAQESLNHIVSWRHVPRFDDDYYLPETPANVISRRTEFTIGTCWFPDGREFAALIPIDDESIVGVTVYESIPIYRSANPLLGPPNRDNVLA